MAVVPAPALAASPSPSELTLSLTPYQVKAEQSHAQLRTNLENLKKDQAAAKVDLGKLGKKAGELRQFFGDLKPLNSVAQKYINTTCAHLKQLPTVFQKIAEGKINTAGITAVISSGLPDESTFLSEFDTALKGKISGFELEKTPDLKALAREFYKAAAGYEELYHGKIVAGFNQRSEVIAKIGTLLNSHEDGVTPMETPLLPLVTRSTIFQLDTNLDAILKASGLPVANKAERNKAYSEILLTTMGECATSLRQAICEKMTAATEDAIRRDLLDPQTLEEIVGNFNGTTIPKLNGADLVNDFGEEIRGILAAFAGEKPLEYYRSAAKASTLDAEDDEKRQRESLDKLNQLISDHLAGKSDAVATDFGGLSVKKLNLAATSTLRGVSYSPTKKEIDAAVEQARAVARIAPQGLLRDFSKNTSEHLGRMLIADLDEHLVKQVAIHDALTANSLNAKTHFNALVTAVSPTGVARAEALQVLAGRALTALTARQTRDTAENRNVQSEALVAIVALRPALLQEQLPPQNRDSSQNTRLSVIALAALERCISEAPTKSAGALTARRSAAASLVEFEPARALANLRTSLSMASLSKPEGVAYADLLLEAGAKAFSAVLPVTELRAAINSDAANSSPAFAALDGALSGVPEESRRSATEYAVHLLLQRAVSDASPNREIALAAAQALPTLRGHIAAADAGNGKQPLFTLCQNKLTELANNPSTPTNLKQAAEQSSTLLDLEGAIKRIQNEILAPGNWSYAGNREIAAAALEKLQPAASTELPVPAFIAALSSDPTEMNAGFGEFAKIIPTLDVTSPTARSSISIASKILAMRVIQDTADPSRKTTEAALLALNVMLPKLAEFDRGLEKAPATSAVKELCQKVSNDSSCQPSTRLVARKILAMVDLTGFEKKLNEQIGGTLFDGAPSAPLLESLETLVALPTETIMTVVAIRGGDSLGNLLRNLMAKKDPRFQDAYNALLKVDAVTPPPPPPRGPGFWDRVTRWAGL